MTYMLATHEEQIAKEWEKYKSYTVRPLTSTVSYYDEIISSHSKARAMLYGGTPEIRSIFQKLDYPVTIVDRAEEIVRAMGLLTSAKQAFSDNEHYIKKEWLQLDNLSSEPFDLLIGDDAINMVQWPDFALFLQQAAKQLKIGGLFICHLLVKPDEELIQKTCSELEKEFKQGLIPSVYDLASRLNFICWEAPTFKMGWQQTIRKLGHKKLSRFKPHFDFVDIFGLCNSQFYCPPIHLFEKLLESYFVIKEIFYPHEHDYCLYEPVYLLEKK